ncbi:uncharacterized protein LOC114337809 isoform X2 [Diabrotica virgifera virgifera]|uniref:C2H2-type domain-containing protein n=2 Tax=Diabrotica virgifera virgifera TaxID=50390 RepID=A0ABM5JNX5_DIAVI|nr:uncharacterized protein LOC114337809 isoform X2 [Diabrotica virgifera virgifera]
MSEKVKEPPICRTCLCTITGHSYSLHENSGLDDGLKYTHILRSVVPALYLGLSNRPEICAGCKEDLITSYKFRQKCLETEHLICNYLQNLKLGYQVIELSSVIKHIQMHKMKKTADIILSDWNDDSNEGTTSSGKPVQLLSQFQDNILVTDNKGTFFNIQPFPTENRSPPTLVPIEDEGTEVPLVKIKEEKDDFDQESEIQQEPQAQKQIHMEKMSTSNTEEGTEENVLGICEDTGLLKDQNGHYFDLYGNALEKDEVEAARRRGIVSEKELCKITNVFTLNENEGNEEKKDSQISDEKKIDDGNIPKEVNEDDSQKNTENDLNKTSPPTTSEIDQTPISKPISYLRPVNINNLLAKEHIRMHDEENTENKDVPPKQPEFKSLSELLNRQPLNADTNTEPIQIKQEPMDIGDEDSDTLSLPEEIGHPPNVQKIINKLFTDEGKDRYVDTPDLIRIQNCSISDIRKMQLDLKNRTSADVTNTSKSTALASVTNETSNKANIGGIPVDSQSPVIRRVVQSVSQGPKIVKNPPKYLPYFLKNKEGATVTLHNNGNLYQLKIDKGGNIINQRTQPMVLIAGSQIPGSVNQASPNSVNQPQVSNQTANVKLSPTQRRQTKPPVSLLTEQVLEMSEDITKRNAQYCKSYRRRKKAANQGAAEKITSNKTNSDYCRMYRQRKKRLVQEGQSENEVLNTPSTSSLQMTSEPQPVTNDLTSSTSVHNTYSYSPKKKRFRIEPVDDPFDPDSKDSQATNKQLKEPNNSQVLPPRVYKGDVIHDDEQTWDPNNSRLVPTFYNYNGYFVHDHDYLKTPYVRSGMLNKTTAKMKILSCYICGFVHPIEKHVGHMRRHSRFCKVCKRNFLNGLMVNSHMKTHKVECVKCGKKVPVGVLKHHVKNNCGDFENQKFLEGQQTPMKAWTPEHDALLKETYKENAHLPTSKIDEVLSAKFLDVFGETLNGYTLRMKASTIKDEKCYVRQRVSLKAPVKASVKAWTPSHDALLKKTAEENAHLPAKKLEEVLSAKFLEVFDERLNGFTLRVKAGMRKRRRARVTTNKRHSKIGSDIVNLGASTSGNSIEGIKCKKEKPEEKSQPNPYVQLTDVLITHPEAAPTVSPRKRDEIAPRKRDEIAPRKRDEIAPRKRDEKVFAKELAKTNDSDSSDSPDHDSDPDYTVQPKRRRILPRRSLRCKQNSNAARQNSNPVRQNSNPTGQNSIPSRNSNPARQNASPAGQNLNPAGQNSSPSRQSSNPARQNSSPARQNSNPAGQNLSPARESSSPARESSSPARESSSPAGQNSSPARKNSNPAGQNLNPARENSSPARQNASPARQNSSPFRQNSNHARQNSSPARQNSNLDGQNFNPARETLSPARESSSPAEQNSSPARQNSNNAGENSSPARQSSSPARQNSSPARQNLNPAGQNSSPARQSSSPARQNSNLARQTSSPARQNSNPARQSSSPARQSSSPARQSSSPARQNSSPARQNLNPATKMEIQTRSTRKMKSLLKSAND